MLNLDIQFAGNKTPGEGYTVPANVVYCEYELGDYDFEFYVARGTNVISLLHVFTVNGTELPWQQAMDVARPRTRELFAFALTRGLMQFCLFNEGNHQATLYEALVRGHHRMSVWTFPTIAETHARILADDGGTKPGFYSLQDKFVGVAEVLVKPNGPDNTPPPMAGLYRTERLSAITVVDLWRRGHDGKFTQLSKSEIEAIRHELKSQGPRDPQDRQWFQRRV